MMVLLSALAAEMSANPGMMRPDPKPPAGSKPAGGLDLAGGYRGALNAQAAPASGRGLPDSTSNLVDRWADEG